MQVRNNIRDNNDRRHSEHDKKKLAASIEKKFKTTMIGALSKFEKYFGYLWGYNKSSLTADELAWKKLWDEVRTEILNNGNNQLRAAHDDILQCRIVWDGYKIKFITQENDRNE